MGNRTLLSYLIVSTVFLVLAVITGFEFSSLPYNGTWGSDAGYYYLAASGHGGENSCGAYLGYGYVCTFSVFLAVLPLPIAFYCVIGLVYIFLVFRYFRPIRSGDSDIVWMVAAFNPIVIWTFLKGVKEGFVILFLLVLVKLYGKVVERRTPVEILVFAGAIFVLSTVKFETVAFVALAGLSTEVVMRMEKRVRTATLIAVFSILSLFMLDQFGKMFPEVSFLEKLMAHKTLFFNEEIDQSDTSVNYLFAIARFLLGPGPITPIASLFGDTGFYEPTVIGKILIFWGSIFWLCMLGLAVLGGFALRAVPVRGAKINLAISREVVFSAFAALYYVLTYAFMYGGMVDTRHRAVVYVLLVPLVVPLASRGLMYFGLNKRAQV